MPLFIFLDMDIMNIYEFIEFTKKHKEDYICYCEIIIDPYGRIIRSIPSHVEAVLQYAAEKENKTRDEIAKSIPLYYLPLNYLIDKYGLIAVWYDKYTYGTYKYKRPNRFQRRSLNILIRNGLIIEDYISIATAEYKNYI